MKLIALALILITSTHANYTEIEISPRKQLKNPHILKVANMAMADAVYWEDEGYEFKMLRDSESIYITKLYKDEAGEVQKMDLEGFGTAGGFGWHAGYQEGDMSCSITLTKNQGIYPLDYKYFTADCEVELNGWD